MSVTEKDNVFYCDCGFSWRRGMSGSHYCEDGLREKLEAAEKRIAELEAKLANPVLLPKTNGCPIQQ